MGSMGLSVGKQQSLPTPEETIAQQPAPNQQPPQRQGLTPQSPVQQVQYQQPVAGEGQAPVIPAGARFPRDAWSGQPMIPPQYLPYAAPCPHCGPRASCQHGAHPGVGAGACYDCPPGFSDPAACQQWAPCEVMPQYRRREEYVCDGGDVPIGVRVDPDWSVHGLDIEDTVGHFDTIDGETKVVPSNRVCIYAPRFAAVRKVYGLQERLVSEKSAGYDLPVSTAVGSDIGEPQTVKQHEEPIGAIGQNSPNAVTEELPPLLVRRAHPVIELFNRFATYEDFGIIRDGKFDLSERPQLADAALAASVWQEEQAVQVVLDGKMAFQGKTSFGLGSVYHSKRHPGKPRLRVVKVASHKEARPGDTIEFTLRYDNVGNETIGNVTLIDNLSPRLEYIEGSAQASEDDKADFFTEKNEKGSLVLRWEIIDPLKAGQGGIIRFKCKVR